MTVAIHTIVNGRYRVTGMLGYGGMGGVFAAHDERLGRDVALKMAHPYLAADTRARERFLREARIAAQMRHSNVVRTFDVGDAPEGPYLIQELLLGRTLAVEQLPPRRALAIIRDITSALRYIHEQGFLHCDLKPANIMLVDGETRAVLLDFGIARDVGADVSSLIATPLYLAPERIAGAAPSAASDLYALGIVLYVMLSGQPPFSGSDVNAILLHHQNTPLPPLALADPAARALEGIATRLAAKAPSARYPSAAAVLLDLQRVEDGAMDDMPTPPAAVSSGAVRPAAAASLAHTIPLAVASLAHTAPLAVAAPQHAVKLWWLLLPLLLLLIAGTALMQPNMGVTTQQMPPVATVPAPSAAASVASSAPSAEPIPSPALPTREAIIAIPSRDEEPANPGTDNKGSNEENEDKKAKTIDMIQSPYMTAATAESTAAAGSLALPRGERLLLASVLLLAVLLRLPALHLPLERDEGAYAYVAFDWLNGGLPYRDAFDHKPPLIYLLYMPALVWGQPSALSVRVWACVLHLAGIVLVYTIGRHAWRGAGGLLAALLFAAAGSAFELQGMVLNTDQALVLPALGALFCALRYRQERPGTLAAAGALVAAAALIKPVAIMLAPCLLLAGGRGWVRMGRSAALASLGAVAMTLPVLVYFALRGGLADLLFALFTYNAMYAGESQALFSLAGLADVYAPFVPLTVAAIGGVALLGSKDEQATGSGERRAGRLVAAWCGALLVAAIGSLRPWVHYFYPVLPFMSLLAALGVLWLARNRSAVTPFQRIAAAAAPLLLTAILVLPFVGANLLLAGATPAALAERMYGDDGRDYFANAADVAAFVRERTLPDERIYVFGSEPEVYVLAERRSSSRWIYDYPLRLVDGARAELLRDLGARPPALAVVYYGLRPPGLNRLIDERGFEKIGQFGEFEVFGPPETN